MAVFPTSLPLSADYFASGLVMPSSLASSWFNATQGYNATSGITLASAPSYARTAQITTDAVFPWTGSTPFNRKLGPGTNIIVRMVYDSNITAMATPPQYLIVGRKSNPGFGDATANGVIGQSAQAWQYLANRAGNVVASCTPLFTAGGDINFTDALYGSAAATQPDTSANIHDNLGCDEYVLVPVTAMSQTGGANGKVRFEVKII